MSIYNDSVAPAVASNNNGSASFGLPLSLQRLEEARAADMHEGTTADLLVEAVNLYSAMLFYRGSSSWCILCWTAFLHPSYEGRAPKSKSA